jgi:SAM-dependent methyltransferase
MINYRLYSLTAQEQDSIEQMLSRVGLDPSLEQLWDQMDLAWQQCGCHNRHPNPDKLASFYRHPIWLLNGMFIEQHAESMGHRQAITSAVSALDPKQVLDFGGGFGTLARLLAAALPQAEIAICEPYPPRHGIESCNSFANIRFVSELSRQSVDVLVSTDVLEHVPDPLTLLAAMVDAVRPGGHLLIANCFYPAILCHLPCTFHLRYSFNSFCRGLGLEVCSPCEGSHATLYKRVHLVEPDWRRLRVMERCSQLLFPWREWSGRHLSRWSHRAQKTIRLPRRIVRALRSAD